MQRFKNILYVWEPEVDQSAAMTRAICLATKNRAELTVLAILPPAAAEHLPQITDNYHQSIQERLSVCRTELNIRTEIKVGRAFLEIIRAVLRAGHDLVIKPAENPGFINRLFGSTDMHLLRKCPCPAYLLHPAAKPVYENILAAVDFDLKQPNPAEDALNRQIVALASSIAGTDAARLHLVHAWDWFAEGFMRRWSDMSADELAGHLSRERLLHEEALMSLQSQLRQSIDPATYRKINVTAHLPRGPAQQAVATQAQQLRADLVVMGTVARTGIAGLLIGNTAETILEQIACSVLAIKPPGFITPVDLEP